MKKMITEAFNETMKEMMQNPDTKDEFIQFLWDSIPEVDKDVLAEQQIVKGIKNGNTFFIHQGEKYEVVKK